MRDPQIVRRVAADTKPWLADSYLDVFGTWCLPCQAKYPASAEVARELEAMDVAGLGLLVQDTPGAARRWFSENGGMHSPFAMLDDKTAAKWGVTGAPMGYLISPEGRVERRCFGCDGRWSMEKLPEFVEHLRTREASAAEGHRVGSGSDRPE